MTRGGSIASLATLLAALILGIEGVMGTNRSQLPPCPSSPNCVSSQAEDRSHFVEPIEFSGDVSAAMERMREVIESLPRTKVTESGDAVIRAEFTTALLRFVDDVEIRPDAQTRVLHVRSASRVGYSDLGANRKRVEALRQAFAASH